MTASEPIMPPAPPRFSTTNCWPSAWLSASAQGRAMMSLAPPGAYGTTSLTGRAGHAGPCADARVETMPPANPAAESFRKSRRRMGASPFLLLLSYGPHAARSVRLLLERLLALLAHVGGDDDQEKDYR